MSIHIKNAVKRYGAQQVVNDVSLEVEDGELFVLLGPSGSGKSTLLRMIAGLSSTDGGSITLHGRDVTHLPPQKRGTGFVFQNYALFPHLTAAQNIAFGLEVQRIPKPQRDAPNSSAWQWRERWRPTPPCCCSMSRSARWMSRFAVNCANRCATFSGGRA
ncbi:MAG: ABC transporter ATP-binding protein [Anaerolineae bacterium]|nr:ABC transporter ATP-binding protein [Anaerolineae bacterium]